MELIFSWSKDYETKIKTVDKQHFHLVTLTNEIAAKLSEKSLNKEELDNTFSEILDYTNEHFRDEETLMKEKKIAKVFFDDHVKNHRTFVKQVKEIYADISDGVNKEAVRDLLEFLISWLGFHILGQDQNMAKQIELIDSGMQANQAYEVVMSNVDKQTAPLINALNGLVKVVVKRNNELLELKRSLELKVAEKTRELAASNQTLKALALTDVLTNLPNRRHLFEVLDVILEEARENTLLTSGLMIDLDNFKEVNDVYGHEMGDKVLKDFSTAIKEAIRTDDLFARLGGDEFFILLPDTDEKGAYHLACHLLSIVRNMCVQVGKTPNEKWISSMSVGVATIKPDKIIDANEFMKKADLAVYAAKNAGKNCVRTYSEEILTK